MEAQPSTTQPSLYCKAYYLRQLRAFAGWREERVNFKAAVDALTDDTVVFVHDDFSVTLGIFHGEDQLSDGSSPDWRRFCQDELRFEIPEDLRYRYESSNVA